TASCRASRVASAHETGTRKERSGRTPGSRTARGTSTRKERPARTRNPRMPARVFSALLATDSGRLTAAELSQQLKASAAAVSGGVRYLIGVGMVSREGEPGSRRHYYRVPDHVWDEVVTGRDRLMARWTAVLREGIALVG